MRSRLGVDLRVHMSPPRVLAPASPSQEDQLHVMEVTDMDSKPNVHARTVDVEHGALPVGDEVVPFVEAGEPAASCPSEARPSRAAPI